MNTKQAQGKVFKYHTVFDADLLHELYETDYATASEAFGIFLEVIQDDLFDLESAFHAGDKIAFQKKVHKIKPIFSYTGLSHIYDALDNLEYRCQQNEGPEHFIPVFLVLVPRIKESIIEVNEEHRRLQKFLAN